MTDPVDQHVSHTAPRVVVAATWKDPTTKAVYVHRDLVQVQDAWAEEAHIGPVRASERFGDVESWVAYVQRYSLGDTAFLTWDSRGLHAILDYHLDGQMGGETGRCQWTAVCPFTPSVQWTAWLALANSPPLGQKAAIERLEDLAEDIREPAPADLMQLLRTLRATVNATADVELRPDGTTSVAFSQDKTLRAGGNVELPSQIVIAIPVLRGHVDGEGKPVLYRLAVRARVQVDNSAHLAIRFTIPTAERVLEAVYADRVAVARALLGERVPLFRQAD